MIEPRYRWTPPRARSLGRECCQWWRYHGGILFEWQEEVIEGMLGLLSSGQWASKEDGLDVARQNGKGVVLQAIEGFAVFELGYRLVMHTAHEFATSQEHQLRLEAFIQGSPELDARVKPTGGYKHANGQESINLLDGARIAFKARTKGGARGYSGDLLVWDEAMVIPDTVVGAQMPMTRASKAPHGRKVIYAGSAVDQDVHEYGVTFARIRARGIAQDPRVSWHEWSAPFDHPSELTEDDLLDPANHAAANPSTVDGLIALDEIVDEIASMPTRTAIVELLGVGDWPAVDGGDVTLIDIKDWDRLRAPGSRLQIEDGYTLAFDVSPDRRKASVAFAGRNQDDQFHVEVQECRTGTGWVVDWIAGVVDREPPEAVICDGASPAAALVVHLERAGVKVEVVTAPEHARSVGRLIDMVEDGTLAHLGSGELRDAIRGSKTRDLGDAKAWSRKNSSVDITPLVAATLALGGAAGVVSGEVVIY